MIPLLLIAQAASLPAAPANGPQMRFERCLDLATADPGAAEAEAGRWLVDGGGALARQCLGMAYSKEGKWAVAAGEFEAAGRAADAAKDPRAARYWAQAGNAWLAARDAAKARVALDAALAPNVLTGLDRGEALLDRARAGVAANDLDGARNDIDAALTDAAKDPLAWLLSATLARRMNDLPRARQHIAEALRLSGDDASVQLEAGNIAAAGGDEPGARAAWQAAVRLAPDGPAGQSASRALAQFVKPATP